MVVQGYGDIIIPEGTQKKDPSKLRVPLYLSLTVSPLVILSGIAWHTRDFNRAMMIGVSGTPFTRTVSKYT